MKEDLLKHEGTGNVKFYFKKMNTFIKNIHINKITYFIGFVMFLSIMFSVEAIAQRKMEFLTRGLVAVKKSNQVFLSWRIFATDSSDISFNIYRDDSVINKNPVSGLSNYIDSTGTTSNIYYLETIYDSTNAELSAPVVVWSNPYLSIPLQTPTGYFPNDCSVADLDGDGELEIIVKMEGASRDNSQSGVTDPVYIQAYKMNGTMLWSINLGINIRSGAHYTQFMVYDLDGNGRAELACKTAPGTKDGKGLYLSNGPAAADNDAADYRNGSGYILTGPEYLTVFSGLTGEEISTVDYVPVRGNLSTWGDTYGNRVDRFLACVAYFDTIPSLVMCRGYYDRTTLTAWDFKNNQLVQRWAFDTETNQTTLRQYEGQGAHCITVGEVDGDGKDEIMYGAMAFDDDGTPLYNTKFCHGDATHLGDFIPSHPGLEFYMPSETGGWVHDGVTNPGIHVRDAATGQVVWSIPVTDSDVGRAMTADITAANPGNEFWAASGLGVYNSSGQVISSSFPPINFAAWWDGDLLREMLDGVTVSKWGSGNIFSASGCSSNNGTKSTPALSGDILGDWREEVMFRTTDNQSLRIYTTTIPTSYGIYTLLQDPQYRQALTWQNVAYNQPPHPSFFIGAGMTTPPVPDIKMIDPSDFPTVNIASPSNGFELGLGLDLNVIAVAVGLPDTNQMVIISIDSVPIDTIMSPPYKINIPGLTTGNYILKASGYSKKGELIESSPIEFSVDMGYPHITLTSPVENSTFLPEDSISIIADAFDTDGTIDSIIFFINNEPVKKLTTTPYSFKIENPGIGVFYLKAIAYDNNSNNTETGLLGFEVGLITTIQENKTGSCGFNDKGGTVDINHDGFTGDGFSNSANVVGAQIFWAVYFPESVNYRFVWRYASTSSRPAKLLINDTLAANISFDSSGDWVNWIITSGNAFARKGILKVAIEASTAEGLANIDYIKIISTETDQEVKAQSCGFLPDPVYINELSDVQDNYNLFPVPVNNFLRIRCNDNSEKIKDVTILSMDGIQIQNLKNVNNNFTEIELSGLHNGVYLIRLSTNKGIYIRKFNVNR